jgi:hypothetical protein
VRRAETEPGLQAGSSLSMTACDLRGCVYRPVQVRKQSPGAPRTVSMASRAQSSESGHMRE